MIGKPSDIPSSFGTTQLLLPPGSEHNLLVTPTFIRQVKIQCWSENFESFYYCCNHDTIVLISSADSDISKYSPDKRQCLFPDDLELDFFKKYSFSNCILECYIKKATDLIQCKPWFFPRMADSLMKTCDPWNTTTFMVEMTKMDQSQCSHCLSDCDSVKYQVSSTSNKIE